jgi:DNA-binding transcriptional regulator GbsR (MarR family)
MEEKTIGATGLMPFQRECINLFVRAAQVLSIPRSVGEIYGLLYSSRDPLAMDDIIHSLEMSKGSASQGLRWLRDIGAVRTSYVPGDRRDFFEAETELRKLVFGFLRDSVEPHLQRGVDHLARADNTIESIGDARVKQFAENRMNKLRQWHKLFSRILPLLARLGGRF